MSTTAATKPQAGRPAPILGEGPSGGTSRLAVYVHFPWCLRKCPYCDFVSFAAERDEIDHAGYAEAVLAEIAARADVLARHRLATIFFGGGTPSLWEPRELGRVLSAIVGDAGSVADDLEVTVECNPTSLDAERAAALVDAGVNRLSVGVQSLDAERLAFLGRLHEPAGALEAVRVAVAAAPRASADLIYGVATERGFETPEEAALEARTLADLGLGHVSAYALTIEPNTRFGELARKGRLPLLEDDIVAQSFEAVGEALAPHGLDRYEISNFAAPGEEARHNLAYWRGDDYLGLGCAAYGTLSSGGGHAVRYRNPPNAEKYLARAHAGRFEPHEREALDPETRLRERLMLGLRLSVGLDLTAASADLGVNPWTAERTATIARLVARGRLVHEGSRLRIPAAARLHSDGIAAELF
jgi:putative oxygen-independent coproporphyrinogen III oxidase